MAEPTNYIESNALLAMQEEDEDHAEECLMELMPGELRVLERACQRLGDLARHLRHLKEAGRRG